jgi:GxxExxY protein
MLLKELTHDIIGAYYDVCNTLGHGFLESTYQRAMVVALNARGLSARTEVPVNVHCRGVNVGDFRLDLVVNDTVIVECKAVEKLSLVHRAQLLHYLRATSFPLGLLFNFGPEPKLYRFIQTQRRLQEPEPHSSEPGAP